MSEPRNNGYEAESGEGDLRLRELWYVLVRSRWLVLGITTAMIAGTALWTWRQRPVFESEATLRIEENDPGKQVLGDMGSALPLGRGKIETEMVVLRSRQVAEAVVDSLGLMLQVVEPARPRSDVLRALRMNRDAPPGTFEMERVKGNVYTIRAKEAASDLALPEQVEIGKPFRVGEATLALAPSLAKNPPEKIVFAVRPFRAAVGGVRNALTVSRLVPNAQVVTVQFRSTDPELAAAIPNAVSGTFLTYKREANRSEAHSTVNFLREQVASYEAELARAENELRTFREREGVVSLGDEASQNVQRLAQLQAERERLRVEHETLGRLLARIGNARRGTETSPYRQLASFPVFLSNRAVQDILQSLSTLENQRAELIVRRTETNFDVQGVDQRIQELELQLFQIASNYLESLETQIASADNSLSRFGTQLQEIPGREVEFARFSRQQSLVAQIYTLLLTRLKEAEIREAVEPSDVRVIDPALVPTSPISPRPLRNLVLGGVLGLMVGVAAAFARQATDTKIRSREDVDQATSGAPVLGMIPRIRSASASAGNGKAGKNGKGSGAGHRGGIIPVSPQDLLEDRLVTRLDPHSPASEAYRSLRTNITFASSERTPQVVVVTSALPGDGKSTSASNLAITLAQQGTRTLLIDADLRRGVLHRVFDVKQEPGLTHVLLGRTPLDEAVQQIQTGETGLPLDFLSAGVFPPNPAELLGSERMRLLLQTLRERYEMIIFDAPPLNLVTDAAVLGTSADATVLVARTGVTDKRALHHAAAQIYHLGAPLGGVVLNDVDAEGSAYYGDSYGYTYGYRYGEN